MKLLTVKAQRPGRNIFIPLLARGPENPEDPEWDKVLSGLYRKITDKVGPGHVFSFVGADSEIIEIEDNDTFVAAVTAVNRTIKDLTLRYVRTASDPQSDTAATGAQMLYSVCTTGCVFLFSYCNDQYCMSHSRVQHTRCFCSQCI